jgi:hypothetical protein
MADIFKQFVKHMDGVNKAAVADAASRAMAEHCDQRIDAMKAMLKDILQDCRDCADNAAEEGRKGEARSWRALAARINNVIRRG